MLPNYFTTLTHWMRSQVNRLRKNPSKPPAYPPPLSLTQLARYKEAELPAFVRHSRVAMHYVRWFGRLDWENFPERSDPAPDGHEWRGPDPDRKAPYVAAFLVKIDRSLPHMRDLRRFLVENPALPWLFGFPLVPSENYPWGFDIEASLPAQREFNRVLRRLPNSSLQFLLSNTIALIQAELPTDFLFGDQISLDTKHIIAWVRENNPKEFIKGGRFHQEKQPKGDPDCRVGFKANGNQTKAKGDTTTVGDPVTPTTQAKAASHVRPGDYLWGYASGVVATKIPGWCEVVLAELTQAFDKSEVSYFFPLMKTVEQRLGRRPRFAALDAAFDAFYVYEYFHPKDPTQPGFAAVPLRTAEARRFDPHGLPLCEAELAMPLRSTFIDRSHLVEHQAGRYACPLLFPEKTGDICPIAHKNWPKGGCLTTLPTSIGTRLRAQLDRKSVQFQALYTQRTATERINSLAVELGIERPHLRNGGGPLGAIANQNTLIYIILNLRALQRIQTRKTTATDRSLTADA